MSMNQTARFHPVSIMKKSILIFIATLSFSIAHAQPDTVFWRVDNLTSIGGNAVQILGSPTVIQTEIGTVVEFDGIDDGLIVSGNPMTGATSFTTEIIFKPYSGGGVEQRFLHMQQDNDNRILIELRNNNDENWSLDTFIKSGSSSMALLDYSYVHSLDEWAHAALIYKDGKMEHYVNGEKELEGEVDYIPVFSGETSLGVRLNQVSWFKGAIHSVRVTHDVLAPDDFMDIEMLSPIENVEAEAVIFDIFPNPIQAIGHLKYQLENSSHMSIELLNREGKKVKTIFSGDKNAGLHELEFNCENIDPGIYFMELIAEGKRAVRKCLID